jgi:hypothetical protein
MNVSSAASLPRGREPRSEPECPVSAAGAGVTDTLTLHASDGYALSATRYRSAGVERARLVLAGATGVPQGFYRRFAEYRQQPGLRGHDASITAASAAPGRPRSRASEWIIWTGAARTWRRRSRP